MFAEIFDEMFDACLQNMFYINYGLGIDISGTGIPPTPPAIDDSPSSLELNADAKEFVPGRGRSQGG